MVKNSFNIRFQINRVDDEDFPRLSFPEINELAVTFLNALDPNGNILAGLKPQVAGPVFLAVKKNSVLGRLGLGLKIFSASQNYFSRFSVADLVAPTQDNFHLIHVF